MLRDAMNADRRYKLCAVNQNESREGDQLWEYRLEQRNRSRRWYSYWRRPAAPATPPPSSSDNRWRSPGVNSLYVSSPQLKHSLSGRINGHRQDFFIRVCWTEYIFPYSSSSTATISKVLLRVTMIVTQHQILKSIMILLVQLCHQTSWVLKLTKILKWIPFIQNLLRKRLNHRYSNYKQLGAA